jgi:hypothetical protein
MKTFALRLLIAPTISAALYAAVANAAPSVSTATSHVNDM